MNPDDRNDAVDTYIDADTSIDPIIRAHFAARRRDIAVPAFETVMSAAEAQRRSMPTRTAAGGLSGLSLAPGRSAWGVGTAAAAVLLVLVYLGTGSTPDTHAPDERLLAALPAALTVSQQQLVEDISRTTRWQAPSDQWLAVRANPAVQGLPDLGPGRNPTGIISGKEKKVWL